jgi:hypothetical protein
MGDLIDGTRTTGKFVFQGGQSPTPSHVDEVTPATCLYDGKINPVLLQESKTYDSEGTTVSPPSL